MFIKDFWKANAEEEYIQVPISVLRYITELETVLEHTIESFKYAQTDFQRGRVFEAEKILHALRIPDVVGRSEQLKAFADYAQKRMWEDGDKDLSEFVDEFLRL